MSVIYSILILYCTTKTIYKNSSLFKICFKISHVCSVVDLAYPGFPSVSLSLWKIGIKTTLIIGSGGCTASDNLIEKSYEDRKKKAGPDKTTKGDRRPSVRWHKFVISFWINNDTNWFKNFIFFLPCSVIVSPWPPKTEVRLPRHQIYDTTAVNHIKGEPHTFVSKPPQSNTDDNDRRLVFYLLSTIAH